MTEDYVYNNNGFTEGFSIQMLRVEKLDTAGIPEKYNYDSVRVDLNYSHGKVKKKIWFHKENKGYYWVQNLKNEYKTIPIHFEEGKWYILWSNTLKSGLFKTNHHEFYIFRESTGKLNIKQKIWQTNL